MMSFCNLFMERPSYFSFISVVRRQHDKSQASQWNKWRKKLDSLKRCVRTKSLTRSKNQKGWFAAHCHDVNVLLSNSSLFGELFQERRHRLHGDRVSNVLADRGEFVIMLVRNMSKLRCSCMFCGYTLQSTVHTCAASGPTKLRYSNLYTQVFIYWTDKLHLSYTILIPTAVHKIWCVCSEIWHTVTQSDFDFISKSDACQTMAIYRKPRFTPQCRVLPPGEFNSTILIP